MTSLFNHVTSSFGAKPLSHTFVDRVHDIQQLGLGVNFPMIFGQRFNGLDRFQDDPIGFRAG